MNDANPYTPPVPVEEDAPGYDLRKSAKLYNRLGVVLKWIVLLLLIFILLGIVVPHCLILLDLSVSTTMFIFRVFYVGLILPANLLLIFLWLYSIFVIVPMAFALKYRAPAMLLIILGAIYGILCILVMFLLRRRAAQILRDAGIEITGGKVDLAKIPVENDY